MRHVNPLGTPMGHMFHHATCSIFARIHMFVPAYDNRAKDLVVMSRAIAAQTGRGGRGFRLSRFCGYSELRRQRRPKEK